MVWLKAHASELSLNPERLHIQRVVNPTGWHANVSTTISDGTLRLHVKLGSHLEELRQVYTVGPILTSRYRMPPILAWIDLGGFGGIVMPSIQGELATVAVIPRIIELADLLYRDDELVRALPEDGQPDTFREAFLDLWINRFQTDLDELEAESNVPPFVTSSLMRWMREETARLADMTSAASFDGKPAGAVHGDLHLANVIVESTTIWWLIDWDGLRCGDPAADFAMLLSPLIEQGEPVAGLLGARDKSFCERFAVSQRAVLLDLVVDSLADWADADRVPEIAAVIRRRKRADHERGLAIYQGYYAS